MASISKRVNGSWVSGDERVMKTATDTINTLPADLYADGNYATVGLEGNMVQNGTPTPTNPIQPSECGELKTSGEHSGQYKIPISSANTTTPVYLGEVETTRRVKKLVLTGNETPSVAGAITDTDAYHFPNETSDYKRETFICSHMPVNTSPTSTSTHGYIGQRLTLCFNKAMGLDTTNKVKAYLADQYAAGTPVTVWYVLATETTGIVNEPLRKIGTYADEVSGITIPTIAGANTISVDTTLQPSEVSVNYKGWHPVQSVHEAENGQWD